MNDFAIPCYFRLFLFSKYADKFESLWQTADQNQDGGLTLFEYNTSTIWGRDLVIDDWLDGKEVSLELAYEDLVDWHNLQTHTHWLARDEWQMVHDSLQTDSNDTVTSAKEFDALDSILLATPHLQSRIPQGVDYAMYRIWESFFQTSDFNILPFNEYALPDLPFFMNQSPNYTGEDLHFTTMYQDERYGPGVEFRSWSYSDTYRDLLTIYGTMDDTDKKDRFLVYWNNINPVLRSQIRSVHLIDLEDSDVLGQTYLQRDLQLNLDQFDKSPLETYQIIHHEIAHTIFDALTNEEKMAWENAFHNDAISNFFSAFKLDEKGFKEEFCFFFAIYFLLKMDTELFQNYVWKNFPALKKICTNAADDLWECLERVAPQSLAYMRALEISLATGWHNNM